MNLEELLACPRCATPLPVKNKQGMCKKCKFEFRKEDGIWRLLYTEGKQVKTEAALYDSMHKEEFGGPNDGSYEILAAMARGNRTVDIACGEGLIERLAPETVGVEFSLNALKKAKKNGAKHLVLADAHALPFKDNAFDVAICAGSLEHFPNPQKAIKEMARVSRIQVLTVHRYPPVPLARFLFNLATFLLRLTHQPVEQPFSYQNLERLINKAGLHIVFNGVWTLPLNYGKPIKWLPEFKNIPSCWFIIAIKK